MSNSAVIEIPPALVRVRRIIAFARELRHVVPAPRGTPFYGLDSQLPFGFETLEPLSSRGIFRKYELVLMQGAGLGGAARWLVDRLGCRIVAVEPDPTICIAAMTLSRRTGSEAVRYVAGQQQALPLRSRWFTHVWRIGAPELQEDWIESLRVVRPGGHFGLQSLPHQSDDLIPHLCDQLARAGFEAIESESDRAAPLPRTVQLARQRFGDRAIDAGAEPAAIWRLFARRPS
ncbi:MAG TPA: methyltransferase domain-containing protein [Terriglobales bacterium]|nr:methyltransferase domain-containing protein [Terriglobales bacterium]